MTPSINLDTGLPPELARQAGVRFILPALPYISKWSTLMKASDRINLSPTGDLTASVRTLPADPVQRAEAYGLALLIQRLWMTCILEVVQQQIDVVKPTNN